MCASATFFHAACVASEVRHRLDIEKTLVPGYCGGQQVFYVFHVQVAHDFRMETHGQPQIVMEHLSCRVHLHAHEPFFLCARFLSSQA